MRNHTVQISDRDGRSFKMALSTESNQGIVLGLVRNKIATFFTGDPHDLPSGKSYMSGLRAEDQNGRIGAIYWGGQVPGDWRTLDQGFLRYAGGKLVEQNESGNHIGLRDVILLAPDGTWGMKLFEYENDLDVHAEGAGTVNHPWVVGFAPGKFSWVLID